MDPILQEKFRAEIHEGYMKNAFECLANFSLVSQKNGQLVVQRKDYQKRLKEAQERLANPAGETSDAKYKSKKAAQDDIKKYKDALEATRKSGEKVENEAIDWREKAMTIMERAEFISTFKVNTPEEMEALKKQGTVPVKTAEEIQADFDAGKVEPEFKKTEDGFEIKP